MERLTDIPEKKRARLPKAMLAIGLIAVTSACSGGKGDVLRAELPSTILSEDEYSYYVVGTGYDHWETDYSFVVEQCERQDSSFSDADGCVDLSITVSESTFNEFDPGDVIVFEGDRHAVAVNGS